MMTTTDLQKTSPPAKTPGSSRSSGTASNRIVANLMGLVRLDPATARSIGRSRESFGDAAIIALGVAITGVVVSDGGGLGRILLELLQAYGIWMLGAVLLVSFGATLLGTPTTREPNLAASLRLLGYAQAPLILGIVGIVGPLSGLAGFVAWILTIATTAFAVRHLLRVSWRRAVIGALAIRLIVAIPLGMIGAVLFLGGSILGGIF